MAGSNTEADWRDYLGLLDPEYPWPWIGRSAPRWIALFGAPEWSTLLGAWTTAPLMAYAVSFGDLSAEPLLSLDGVPVRCRIHACQYNLGAFGPVRSVMLWTWFQQRATMLRIAIDSEFYGHWISQWNGPQIWGQREALLVASSPAPPDSSGLLSQRYRVSLADFLPGHFPVVPVRHSRILPCDPDFVPIQLTSLEYLVPFTEVLDMVPDNAAPDLPWFPHNWGFPNPPPPA